MSLQTQYQYLEPHPKSNYRQLWVKGRRIRAEVLYRATIGPESQTADEVAQDFGLPVEVVREAIDYCNHHPDVLEQDRRMEEESIRVLGLDRPPHVPSDYSAGS